MPKKEINLSLNYKRITYFLSAPYLAITLNKSNLDTIFVAKKLFKTNIIISNILSSLNLKYPLYLTRFSNELNFQQFLKTTKFLASIFLIKYKTLVFCGPLLKHLKLFDYKCVLSNIFFLLTGSLRMFFL